MTLPLRLLAALAALAVAGCRTSAPTVADMEKFYKAAEQQAQRDIVRLAQRRDAGEISQDEYVRREAEIRESVARRASQMAWTRHELVESEMRSQGIPTGDRPVPIEAPNQALGGDTFYRAAGQMGPGYQGIGAYQPASRAGTFLQPQ